MMCISLYSQSLCTIPLKVPVKIRIIAFLAAIAYSPLAPLDGDVHHDSEDKEEPSFGETYDRVVKHLSDEHDSRNQRDKSN